MKAYRTFDTTEQAIAYRKEQGTGGYVFAPTSAKELGYESILFPYGMTPTPIFNHPLTRGISGVLL